MNVTARQHRSQRNGNLVADATRRMLVNRSEASGPLKPIAGIDHAPSKRGCFLGRHPLKERRHGEGRHLVVRDRFVRVSGNQKSDFLIGQRPSVPLVGD